MKSESMLEKQPTAESALDIARRVIRMEADALRSAEQRLGAEFESAVKLIAAATGRVIVSGLGKSGIIGRKIAATLTSTGSPANFLHPVEGLGGRLAHHPLVFGEIQFHLEIRVFCSSREINRPSGIRGKHRRCAAPNGSSCACRSGSTGR